jgi:hypothetical protein
MVGTHFLNSRPFSDLKIFDTVKITFEIFDDHILSTIFVSGVSYRQVELLEKEQTWYTCQYREGVILIQKQVMRRPLMYTQNKVYRQLLIIFVHYGMHY